MCDYSLHHVGSRAAKVDDKLVTTDLARSSTRGFAAVGELGAKLVIDEAPPKVAVCLMPGTELAFDENVKYERGFNFFGKACVNQKLARFRQIETDDPHVHHDALEFADGQVLKVTRLASGQTARVLQLPVASSHHEHHHERLAPARDAPRLAMNRVQAGLASVLLPSQSTVMLWQSCRKSVARLSIALESSFRRLRVQRPAVPPAEVDATPVTLSFENGMIAMTPANTTTARTPEKKFEAKAGM